MRECSFPTPLNEDINTKILQCAVSGSLATPSSASSLYSTGIRTRTHTITHTRTHTRSKTSDNGMSAMPSATPCGRPNKCTKFKMAAIGQTCGSFARANGIKLGELYRLNPLLGPTGAACYTRFRAGGYYCVAGSSSSGLPSALGVSSS